MNLLIVDVGDHVARQDAGLGRGRIVDRRDHLDEAVFHRDLDAEPAELAMGGLLHVAPALLIHVARMRIERGDHAVDGAFHQLGIVGLLDVAGLDPLEHVAEQIELRVGIRNGPRPLPPQPDSPLRPHDENGQTGARCGAEKKGKIPAHREASLFLSADARTFAGRIRRPSSRRHQLTMAFWSDQGTPTRGNTAFGRPYRLQNDLMTLKQGHFLTGEGTAFAEFPVECNVGWAEPGSAGFEGGNHGR